MWPLVVSTCCYSLLYSCLGSIRWAKRRVRLWVDSDSPWGSAGETCRQNGPQDGCGWWQWLSWLRADEWGELDAKNLFTSLHLCLCVSVWLSPTSVIMIVYPGWPLCGRSLTHQSDHWPVSVKVCSQHMNWLSTNRPSFTAAGQITITGERCHWNTLVQNWSSVQLWLFMHCEQALKLLILTVCFSSAGLCQHIFAPALELKYAVFFPFLITFPGISVTSGRILHISVCLCLIFSAVSDKVVTLPSIVLFKCAHSPMFFVPFSWVMLTS